MAPRRPCMALAPAHPCMALRHLSRMVSAPGDRDEGQGWGHKHRTELTNHTPLPFQAAAPRITVRRRPCMMAAALLPRVGPGTPTILTRRHGEGREPGSGVPIALCLRDGGATPGVGSTCSIVVIILSGFLSLTGLRKNMNMPSTMSPPHPHRLMGAPLIPKHLATPTPHPHRSTHSTTHRRQGHQPCESDGASPNQCPPMPSALLLPPLPHRP